MAKLCESFYPPWESAIYNWRDFVTVMRTLPTLDHIARARRKVVEKYMYKKYLPTIMEVAQARGYNEQVWREYARQNNIAPPTQLKGSNIPEDMQSKDARDEL